MLTRSSGVLLHPTSLPGEFGIGDFGDAAYQFLDCLKESDQTYWQILPLGPTGFADSPYQCLSSFAGNTNLISLARLAENTLLTEAELLDHPPFRNQRIDYGAVIDWHDEMLTRAFERFVMVNGEEYEDYKAFCSANAYWLDDFALFMALKENFGGRAWIDWPRPYALSERPALDSARREHARRIREHKFRQWVFFGQWADLKRAASTAELQIIGDVPIYVALDSCDVWVNRNLFELDENGRPTSVAGVPPDYFAATGQLWGNPLYRWDEHKKTGYSWWIRRIQHMRTLVDKIRIDHFRAFFNYWKVPATENTAINGKWIDGPRNDFVDAIRDALGENTMQETIIAEDLGDQMKPVIDWRRSLGLPGMRILQFAFGDNKEERARFWPASYIKGQPESDPCILYTGTHDNNTALGWWYFDASEAQRQRVGELLNEPTWRGKVNLNQAAHWLLIEIGMKSASTVFIVPLQDMVGGNQTSRMNTPGKGSGNWRWRCIRKDLDVAVDEGENPWKRLKALTDISNR